MKQLTLLALAVSVALVAGPAVSADPPRAEPSHDQRPLTAPLEKARERLVTRLRERGAPVPSASQYPLLLPPPVASSSAAPLSSSSVAAVRTELARKWREHAGTRHERRERHRAALIRELGQRLSEPAIKAELKLHATRQAELARIKFLAENARHGAQRDSLLARVAKLSDREAARHRTRMAKLLGSKAGPSTSAAQPAPSAARREGPQ